ncbi:MAG TPA: aminotransferase class I/II-fold pyridoxal phosphate-dependent enzyme, partial [candidate division Zixibacteria bacterium]|nr:aminotransferase class I/II-fold pyridoxal phosphate-dependent enzyme [candidate division Zixibacteria bacterium]
KTFLPAGAYYMMIDVSGLFGKSFGGKELRSASDVCAYFIEELGVALTPGEAFGAPAYLRLSFSPAEELVYEACRRIQQGVGA